MNKLNDNISFADPHSADSAVNHADTNNIATDDTNVVTNDNILEVKNLSISFKRNKEWAEVVHKVSFSIKRGEILGLVGESGSGKSVSSLAIMDLLDRKNAKINSGEIIFNGKSKAMIFQEPMTALNPVKKCGPQVDEMILVHKNITKKQAKEQTLSLFNEVMLPNTERIYNSYPFELSGGQRQRVMIAMALSCDADLLIADEPTTALDVTVQKNILSLLKNLQHKRNLAVLFISHDLGVVHSISDKIAVIYKGTIVERNKTEEIFSNPQHIYTKSLIASRPPKDFKPKRLLTVNDFMNNENAVNLFNKQKSESLHQTDSLYNDTEENERKEILLSVKNLYVNYTVKRNLLGKVTQTFNAAKDVSFDVYKGETLGLVGESGCGKTTVGRAITQLINSHSGNIIFENKDISTLSAKEKHLLHKDIQIIFQDPYSSLNPRMTIVEAVEEPMKVYHIFGNANDRRQRAEELLALTGLDSAYLKRYPHELSGGQRQRVGIARALSLNPKLIICDESVSALDVSVQAQVLNLLNDLKENFKFTYLFISHDLSVVKYMSDRIIVMKQGEIVEQGDSERIYHHPEHSYTQNLITSICE